MGAATMENRMEATQKFKIKLPYEAEIRILGIYLKKRKH